MNCRQANKKISLLIDGLLLKKDELMLLEHINACKDCKKLYEDTKAMIGNLGELPELPLPDGMENKIHFALEREAAKPRKKKWIKYVAIAMPVTAAAFAVLLGIGYIFSGGMSTLTTSDEATMMQSEALESSNEESMLKMEPDNAAEDVLEAEVMEAEEALPEEDGTRAYDDEESEDALSGSGAELEYVFSISAAYQGESPEEMTEFAADIVQTFENAYVEEITLDSETQSVTLLLPVAHYEELIAMLQDSEKIASLEETVRYAESYDDSLMFKLIFLFQEND